MTLASTPARALALASCLLFGGGCGEKAKGGSAGTPSTSASAGATAEAPGATVSASAAPVGSASTGPSAPLAKRFAGPTEAKFAKMIRVKARAVDVGVLPGWSTSRDGATTDDVDEYIVLYSPPTLAPVEGSRSGAQVWLGIEYQLKPFDEAAIRANCQRVGVSKATFDAPVGGAWGREPFTGTIAQGQGVVGKVEADVFYATADVDDKHRVVAFASVRRDAPRAVLAEVVDVMKSIRKF